MRLPDLRGAPRPADLARDPVVPLVLRLAGPAILGISAHALQMLANGWFVADLGAAAIATIGIAYPVTLLVAALGYGAGIAAASVLSRVLGRGDRRLADAAASLGFWLALPPGLALTGLIFLHPPFWLGLLGADADLAAAAAPYTALASLGTWLMLAIIVGGFVVRAQGLARLSGAVLVGSFGLNVALDGLLIRVLGLGTAGAGWAAILAQGAGALAYLWHFRRARGNARIRFRPPWRLFGQSGQPAGPLLREMLWLAAPATLSSLLAAAAMALFVQAGAAYGAAAVAGLGLALRIVLVAALPLLGLMAGAQAVIGFAHGAADRPGQRARRDRALGFVAAAALAYGFAAAALMALFSEPLAGVFAEDPAARAEGARATAAFALALAPVGLQLTAATLFQAVGAPRRAAAVSLAAQGLALIPPLLILPRLYGYDGVLASRIVAEFAADALGAALLLAWLRGEGRRAGPEAGADARSVEGGEAVQVSAPHQPAHEGA
ncbi:MATE family efflux transporter [Methylobacterium gregans]|uniref:Multidrug export protein MepA n=1 Tax=Methylobacterium gregans TaxID=374424 RepID=A0AA37HPJ6_9HYPH|nr:MATE family efflux transporter [Methylobacterium gregans]MDQ0520587.1 Na+-driven multidrug efflux pump [Methylobacterium gregans]GJD79191.1 Multidrug export protein MepA [Methylobacterium gregans]GLS56606.1 MATE family efflux transporter [Methylobacterium gregans]